MKPYLVQRIRRAYSYVPEGTPNLVNFYSKEITTETRKQNKPAIDALNSLIPMNYMGCAEFEFGAVSSALTNIVKNLKNLVPFSVELFGMPKSFIEKAQFECKLHETTVILAGWCLKGHEKDLTAFLTSEAADANSYSLKCPSYINPGCFGKVEPKRNKNGAHSKSKFVFEETDITAWLDISNLWFVGKDRKQVAELCRLLDVAQP